MNAVAETPTYSESCLSLTATFEVVLPTASRGLLTLGATNEIDLAVGRRPRAGVALIASACVSALSTMAMEMRGENLLLMVNWTPATYVQTIVPEKASTGVKRRLDLCGLWNLFANTQLHLAVNNLLADDYDSGRTITNNGLAQSA